MEKSCNSDIQLNNYGDVVASENIEIFVATYSSQTVHR